MKSNLPSNKLSCLPYATPPLIWNNLLFIKTIIYEFYLISSNHRCQLLYTTATLSIMWSFNKVTTTSTSQKKIKTLIIILGTFLIDQKKEVATNKKRNQPNNQNFTYFHAGVLRRNRRNFRYPSFKPATNVSRSISSLLFWKV